MDESIKQRNREHAKNTRMRKKVYGSKLSDLVEKMDAQKVQDEVERKELASRICDMQIVRKNMVRLFLSYRGGNVADRSKWSAILDEDVEVTLPITPYRPYLRSEVQNFRRVVQGIDAAQADAASLALMAEWVGHENGEWMDAVKRGETCKVFYYARREDVLAAGDLVVCRYKMKVEGCQRVGCPVQECVQEGMLQCRFNASNRIVQAEFVFDVLGFTSQLQRTLLHPGSVAVPAALEQVSFAACPFMSAMHCVVAGTEPCFIISASEKWLAAFPHTAVGTSLFTDYSLALKVCAPCEKLVEFHFQEALRGRPGSAVVLITVADSIFDKQLLYLKFSGLSTSATASASDETLQPPVGHVLVEGVLLPTSAEDIAAIEGSAPMVVSKAVHPPVPFPPVQLPAVSDRDGFLSSSASLVLSCIGHGKDPVPNVELFLPSSGSSSLLTNPATLSSLMYTVMPPQQGGGMASLDGLTTQQSGADKSDDVAATEDNDAKATTASTESKAMSAEEDEEEASSGEESESSSETTSKKRKVVRPAKRQATKAISGRKFVESTSDSHESPLIKRIKRSDDKVPAKQSPKPSGTAGGVVQRRRSTDSVIRSQSVMEEGSRRSTSTSAGSGAQFDTNRSSKKQ